jgi:hypothetical protein
MYPQVARGLDDAVRQVAADEAELTLMAVTAPRQ